MICINCQRELLELSGPGEFKDMVPSFWPACEVVGGISLVRCCFGISAFSVLLFRGFKYLKFG